MRTKEMYYDNLERISARFPGQEWISVKDVAEWLGDGITPRSLYDHKNTPFEKRCGKWRITAVALARWMS